MKILLTGATGYIGKHLLQSLLRADFEVTLLLRDESRVKLLGVSTEKITVLFLSDGLWKSKVGQVNPDIVIHLAAYLTSADDDESINRLIESNLLFGTHLLDSLKATSFRWFINTGTFAEYSGKNGALLPSYLYAATKTAFRPIIEYYRNLSNFKVINVIPYTVYGGGGTNKKLIDFLFEATFSDKPIDMSPGEQVLDFIHIEDVISFYLSLIKNISSIKEDVIDFHLGTSQGTTPKQVAKIIEKVSGRQPNVNWGGKPYRPRDTMYAVAPKNQKVEGFNWAPKLTIEEGIQKDLNSK